MPRPARASGFSVKSVSQTVAGFMLDRLGSVPKGGEVVALGDYRLTVVDVEKNRISKVKVEREKTIAR